MRRSQQNNTKAVEEETQNDREGTDNDAVEEQENNGVVADCMNQNDETLSQQQHQQQQRLYQNEKDSKQQHEKEEGTKINNKEAKTTTIDTIEKITLHNKTNDEKEDVPRCRICFESGVTTATITHRNHHETSDDDSNNNSNNILISPCGCKGTQKYIHYKCFKNVIHHQSNDGHPSTSLIHFVDDHLHSQEGEDSCNTTAAMPTCTICQQHYILHDSPFSSFLEERNQRRNLLNLQIGSLLLSSPTFSINYPNSIFHKSVILITFMGSTSIKGVLISNSLVSRRRTQEQRDGGQQPRNHGQQQHNAQQQQQTSDGGNEVRNSNENTNITTGSRSAIFQRQRQREQGLQIQSSPTVKLFHGGPVCGGRFGMFRYALLKIGVCGGTNNERQQQSDGNNDDYQVLIRQHQRPPRDNRNSSNNNEEEGKEDGDESTLSSIISEQDQQQKVLYTQSSWENLTAAQVLYHTLPPTTTSTTTNTESNDANDTNRSFPMTLVFQGYTAWSRNQLRREISEGNWCFVEKGKMNDLEMAITVAEKDEEEGRVNGSLWDYIMNEYSRSDGEDGGGERDVQRRNIIWPGRREDARG
mmetsp:Transcript_18062/g.25796  ORF Transcript_18062/g.25796 Transcript_18062/m.25796 type:complete len:585 (-) Transcript_18062:1362-3116(-)